ncbi:hypothetical protein ALT785_370007 [Alteromonas infernus]
MLFLREAFRITIYGRLSDNKSSDPAVQLASGKIVTTVHCSCADTIEIARKCQWFLV